MHNSFVSFKFFFSSVLLHRRTNIIIVESVWHENHKWVWDLRAWDYMKRGLSDDDDYRMRDGAIFSIQNHQK